MCEYVNVDVYYTLEIMGPLFSLAAVLVAGLTLSLLVFVVARLFGVRHSINTALFFSVGAVVGGAVSGMLASFIVGFGATFTAQYQVVTYLVFIGVSALVCGVLAARWRCMF